MANMTLNEQAEKILQMAEENGTQTNFFFRTTFKSYMAQINMLNQLEKDITKEGTLITKEYVKGRKNVYTNPAINSYNKTRDSANKTVALLLDILREWKKEDGAEDIDPLLEIINRGNK